jgi:hypothetical protein
MKNFTKNNVFFLKKKSRAFRQQSLAGLRIVPVFPLYFQRVKLSLMGKKFNILRLGKF